MRRCRPIPRPGPGTSAPGARYRAAQLFLGPTETTGRCILTLSDIPARLPDLRGPANARLRLAAYGPAEPEDQVALGEAAGDLSRVAPGGARLRARSRSHRRSCSAWLNGSRPGAPMAATVRSPSVSPARHSSSGSR